MSPGRVPPLQHLLTMRLERDLRSAQECLGRLKSLQEQGRLWAQDVILQVKDQELVLSDVESKVPGQGTPQSLAPPECWYPPSKVPPKPSTPQGTP